MKFDGRLFVVETDYSPMDVVGWHGNHVPWKYDLSRYNVIESWHKQAQLAGAGRWLELDAYQAEVARTRRRLRRNRGR